MKMYSIFFPSLFALFFFLFSCPNAAHASSQEIPSDWQKLYSGEGDELKIHFHPGGQTPGYFDSRLHWHRLPKHTKSLHWIRYLQPAPLIVFAKNSSRISFIDVPKVQEILAKNKLWQVADLQCLFEIGMGEITLDDNFSPQIYIGKKQFSYPLPGWGLQKLYDLIHKDAIPQIENSSFEQRHKFIRYLRKVCEDNSQYLHQDMATEKFFFVVHAINHYYRLLCSTKPKASDLSYVTQSNSAYAFSIIPFKKGDLDKHSEYLLRNGLRKGFDKVALFLPIHYSGGSSSKRKLERINGKIIEGKHYFYEDIFAVSDAEVDRCLTKILTAGLSLNFVPHLESISNLNRIWESNWRIHCEIPLDREYFKRSYAVLFANLRKNRDKIKAHQEIRITIASEVDPTFLTESNTSYRLVRSLERAIRGTKIPRQQVKLVWNPNGDFKHGWHSSQNRPNADELGKIFSHIDSISPSMYEKYGHLVHGSFRQSKRKFVVRLLQKTQQLVTGKESRPLRQALHRIIRKDFSIGEFSLRTTDSATNYADFHREFSHWNPHGTIVLWTIGYWDHANITGMRKTKHEKDIMKVLRGR